MKFIAALTFTLLSVVGTSADSLPDKPVPQKVHNSRVPEIFAGVQLAVLIADGVTTHENVLRGQTETDPLSRVLLGARPRVAPMILFGTIEEAGCYYIAKKMERSKRFHKVWWVPQVLAIAGHGYGALHNSTQGRQQ
jgi:hypothetical protein